MNKQLKFLTRTVFGMFIVLFFSVTMIQFVAADDLRAHELNGRTLKNSYQVERGSLLVQGNPIAYSVPTGDSYRFARQYVDGIMYSPITGYFSHTQGVTGLEQAMNQDLAGIGNAQFFTRLLRTLTGVEPQGSSVETTINASAQQAAFDAMQGYEGAVVAIEPSTGNILAMVSTPGFDPSQLSMNNSSEIIQNYEALNADPDQPLINRAISGDLYHPGSTYKLLVTAAALENGSATPTKEFKNTAEITLPQTTSTMHNSWNGPCGPDNKVTLERALVLSCNIPFAELAMSMDRNAVSDMASDFGFGQELSIPLTVTPSIAPQVASPDKVALSAIGQLDVRSTPLQMAMVSAGIANGGVVMTPQLVSKVITPDLRVERVYEPQIFAEPISPQTAHTLALMMEKVVASPDGTAAPAGIEDVRVAGKTGTAENGEDAEGNPRPYTLWFTGFAPIDNPRVAIAVVIERGGGEAYGFAGSSTDLPTAVGKQVMEAVLGG